MKSFDDTASGKTLDVKKLFLRALRYWYYFPVFLVLSTVIAFAIYKTTVPLHHISTQVLISSAQDAAAGRVDVGERALPGISRSEEHTSELLSRPHLVCRLLLEKKKEHQSRQH